MGGFAGPTASIDDPNDTRPKLSLLQIAGLTICFLGVQFGWAVQIAFTTPLFLELGVSKALVSFVWIAGPISGFVVQPIVGVLSDRNTSKWGRRRPFIFGGTVFILIGMLVISNAESVGYWFGDTKEKHSVAIGLAVLGFWILDLANNTVQGPCRALLVDVAPSAQQNLGGSFFSFMLGLGNLIGYTTGSRDLVSALPFMGTNLRALFTIGMFTLVICIGITLFSVKERPITKEEVSNTENPFVVIFKGVVRMPVGMRKVCVVQFFAWVGWFTYLLYITSWVGQNIFHGNGDPTATPEQQALFDQGVRAASLGLAINSVVTVVVSSIIAPLSRVIGIKPIYFVGQLVLACCLWLTIWVNTEIEALILIAFFGIPWAVVMVFPFTLVSYAVPVEECGLYMGVLNIFVVLPQLLVSVSVGWVIKAFNGNLAAALAGGGIFALVSAGLVWILNTKPPTAESVTQENPSTNEESPLIR